MALDEQTLEHVAQDGEMDYSKWPDMLDPILERVNHIVYNDFPIPRPYSNVNRPQSPAQSKNEAGDGTQATPTPSTPARNLPPVPLFGTSSATSTSHVPDSMPASQAEGSSSQADELPQVLLMLLNGIITTLREGFTERPPHTIQRLAELVLNPTDHYKTLPAWLRAVDRVVNVSSTADIFPLPDHAPLMNGVNGDTGPLLSTSTSSGLIRNIYDSNSLGSDESLGGALLTPIPWLRNGTHDTEETDDTQPSSATTDNSLGDPLPTSSTDASEAVAAAAAVVSTSSDPLVPERPEGAVTQGELIRMEQEAGVVPVSANPTRPLPGHENLDDEEDDIGDKVPHARGPDLVGAVDMGRVDGGDFEVRIGSPPTGSEIVAEADATADVIPATVDEEATAAATEKARASGSGGSEEDYEMVDKADEMDVDEKAADTGKSTVEAQPSNAQPQVGISTSTASSDMDEDMVLVDANENSSASTADEKPTS